MKMSHEKLLSSLKEVASRIVDLGPVDLVLIGGAAGILTGEFDENRGTHDCDIISLIPLEALERIEAVGKEIAKEKHLREDWLNGQAMSLNVLPDGWSSRKVTVATFDKLTIYSLSRLDLICTKFYAGSGQDREDIEAMKPTPDELTYAKNYL